MWSTPIDLYCERVTPFFWAEPVNALSNIAFLIAAFVALDRWRRKAKGDGAILALIVVVATVGLGSFAFHTVATRAAMLLDITPIGIFIYGYFLLALRRFLGLSWPPALMLLIGFIVLSLGLASLVPRQVLNGSSGYLPVLAALTILGWILHGHKAGQAMMVGAGLFVVSLTFRIVDLDVCATWPLGTHFLWHLFNAAVLYTVLRGAIAERQHPFRRCDEQKETLGRRGRCRYGGVGGGGDAAARWHWRSSLRADGAFRAHRSRHPDDAEFDEGSAWHWDRATAARDFVRALFASQPRWLYRRDHARAADARESLQCALSLHASRRPTRRARLRGAGGYRAPR